MSKKPRKHEEEEHPDETWLVPYSDVLTLLLALFIVLFAVSKVDTEKFKALAESFSVVFTGGSGILPGAGAMLPNPPASSAETKEDQEKTEPVEESKSLDDSKMNAVLNAYLEANKLQQLVSIKATSSGFSIRLLDSVLFARGSDRLLPNALPILDKIIELSGKAPYYIGIEGYTDDTPAATPMGNWELSTNRALAVLGYMQSKGVDPEKLSAVGFGEYHPLLPNITAPNRAMNRRVEINFVSSEYFNKSHYTEP